MLRLRGTGPRATFPRAFFFVTTFAGDRPPRYGNKNASPHPLRPGPVGCDRQIATGSSSGARGVRSGSGDPELRSLCPLRPGSVGQDRQILTCSGKTPPAHRRARACPSPSFVHRRDRGGQAPALRSSRAFFFVTTFAGDRPPRYGEKNVSRYRRAGDRPPRYGRRKA